MSYLASEQRLNLWDMLLNYQCIIKHPLMNTLIIWYKYSDGIIRAENDGKKIEIMKEQEANKLHYDLKLLTNYYGIQKEKANKDFKFLGEKKSIEKYYDLVKKETPEVFNMSDEDALELERDSKIRLKQETIVNWESGSISYSFMFDLTFYDLENNLISNNYSDFLNECINSFKEEFQSNFSILLDDYFKDKYKKEIFYELTMFFEKGINNKMYSFQKEPLTNLLNELKKEYSIMFFPGEIESLSIPKLLPKQPHRWFLENRLFKVEWLYNEALKIVDHEVFSKEDFTNKMSTIVFEVEDYLKLYHRIKGLASFDGNWSRKEEAKKIEIANKELQPIYELFSKYRENIDSTFNQRIQISVMKSEIQRHIDNCPNPILCLEKLIYNLKQQKSMSKIIQPSMESIFLVQIELVELALDKLINSNTDKKQRNAVENTEPNFENLSSNLNNENIDKLQYQTRQIIIDEFDSIDKTKGWRYAFKNEKDYNDFVELLTKYFEHKKYYLPKESIVLERECKTRVAKVLNSIYKELGDNTLRSNKEFFKIVKVLNHFKELSDAKIYKAITN